MQNTNTQENSVGAGVVFQTQSMHLACMLYTIGIEPVSINRDHKEKTPAGDTVVKWIYQSEKNSQAHVEGLELMKEWQKPLESIDWSTLSEAEKANCIKVVRACLKNLRFFIAHVKAGSISFDEVKL